MDIPPPPEPPYDIETMEPLRNPFRWSRPERAGEIDPALWRAPELPLGDGRILVLDADPPPTEEEQIATPAWG